MLKNFINGQWVASFGKDSVEVLNPATAEILEKTPLGTREDVDAAVAAAKLAFKKWRRTPAVDRIQYLFKFKTLLEENFEELAKLCTLEHGKTLNEARGDLRRGIQMVETATSIPTLQMGKSFEDVSVGIDTHAIRRPMGVFAAITPFNFPPMVPLWFWPFAVATGNTFVLKVSERVPLTCARILELFESTGIPKGVINMVHGGKDVVNAMCEHSDIEGVSFVGSTPVAKHVYTTASAHGKRVQALGGAKNFMITLPDADIDHAAATVIDSITGCAGQRCLAGSVVIGVGEAYEPLETKILELIKDVSVGDGMDPYTQVGPVISGAAQERIFGLIQSAVDEGANLLVDGRVGTADMPGFFVKPTVISGVTAEMRIANEEVFGPVILLSQKETFDESIAWMNSSPLANTCSLFTKNGANARHFSYEANPSMIGVNLGVPAPMSFFNFGGAKNSFYGDVKAHGTGAIDFYTDLTHTIIRWPQSGRCK